MSKIALEGNASGTGTFTIASPNSNSNFTLNLPTSSGTVVVTGGAQTIEFAAGSAASPSITFTGDTNTGIFSPAADTIAFSEGGVESMRIDSSGNVGIGTNSPTQRLDVVAANSQIHFGAATTGGGYLMSTANGQFRISGGAVWDGSNWIAKSTTASIIGDDATGDIKFLSNTSLTAGNTFTPTERMRIDSSGNVGIGTSSVATKLNVKGSAATLIESESTGAESYLGLKNSGGYAYVGSSANNLLFLTSVSGTERARITSGGDFLVGVSSTPAGSSHTFYNGASSTWSFRIQSTATTSPNGLLIKYSGASPNGAGDQFLYCEDSGNTQRMSVRSNGGIANYSANNVNLSDRREKTNFAPAKNYLDTVCAIPVQTFNYIDQNNEEDPGLTLGVVAQDVQAVAPELVMESNWGTQEEPKMRLSIYQTDFQYALMKSIQELKAITDAQATRIETLEAEVAALKGQ